MTSRKEIASDSDGSWTWVDNEDENFRKRADQRRASSFIRTEVEDVQPETEPESDISILTDEEPTDAQANTINQLHSDGTQDAPATLKETPKLELVRPGESELAAIDRRARAYLASTTTSAFLMITGLLIAVYFQWGCDSNYSSPVQEYYDEPYMPTPDRDMDYIQVGFKRKGKHKYEQYAQPDYHHAHMMHKNAKEKFTKKIKDGHSENERLRREEKHQRGDKKEKREFEGYKSYTSKDHQKKKNYDTQTKAKRNTNEVKDKFVFDVDAKEKSKDVHKKKYKENDKQVEHKKYTKGERSSSQSRKDGEFQNRKEAFLLNKEHQLMQKELKINAKQHLHDKQRGFQRHDRPNNKRNFTGEWYDKMHEGRMKKRKQEERGTWLFERAQGRIKKRDKAHWYFDMMDEREMKRVKH